MDHSLKCEMQNYELRGKSIEDGCGLGLGTESLTCIRAGIPTPCGETGSPAACFSLSSQHPYPPAAQTGPSTTLTPLRPPLGPGESLPVPFKGVFFFLFLVYRLTVTALGWHLYV